jgi:predicted transcriptional regulator
MKPFLSVSPQDLSPDQKYKLWQNLVKQGYVAKRGETWEVTDLGKLILQWLQLLADIGLTPYGP